MKFIWYMAISKIQAEFEKRGYVSILTAVMMAANGTTVGAQMCFWIRSGPEVILKFFMLNSVEHEIFPAHKC